MQTIEANNELQTLREQEQHEIARILFRLSEDLRAELPAIEGAAEAVAALDVINAKAAFAEAFDCVVPVVWSAPAESRFYWDGDGALDKPSDIHSESKAVSSLRSATALQRAFVIRQSSCLIPAYDDPRTIPTRALPRRHYGLRRRECCLSGLGGA